MLMEVIAEIIRERQQQDFKWGRRDHDPVYWLCVLMEEVGEAAKASIELHLDNYRSEMLQVAAVAIAAIESLDRMP